MYTLQGLSVINLFVELCISTLKFGEWDAFILYQGNEEYQNNF